MIRALADADIQAITQIYNHYIQHTVITFEEELITADQMAKRTKKVSQQGLPWLVAEQSGEVIGYAYATQWKERSAYRFTVEITVYLAPDAAGEGWGSKLYSALLDVLKHTQTHVVIGVITLPNPPSEALHEKFGMKKTAHFTEVGRKFDQWLDVGYWQLMLEK